MPRDYSWARRSIPRGWFTVGELGRLLALGPHQTRRRLRAWGLNYRVVVRRWKSTDGTHWYARRALAIPPESVAALLALDLRKLQEGIGVTVRRAERLLTAYERRHLREPRK